MGGLTASPSSPFALVVNAGSTSLKAAVFTGGSDEPVWSIDHGLADDGPGAADRVGAFERVLREAPHLDDVAVVGHRVVHGGEHFDRPVLLDAAVEEAIVVLEDLAPLHNRAALDGLEAARRLVGPEVPHVAMFDTAFHRSIPPAAAAYGGPHRWLDEGLRRYGFHGISHRHAARAAAEILGRPLDELRLVTCHLGGGCSLTAVDGGRSVDTTMGFTPLDGLVMASRSGAVDPGLIFHLVRTGVPCDELEHLLETGSGLLGLSGVSADLREVVRARDEGDTHAALAVDVFVHRVSTGIGAMAAALGGVDALVFTGGIGEHSAEVRTRVAQHFAFLGVALDEGCNEANPVDEDISAPSAAVSVVVVHAREELAIAQASFELIANR